MTSGRPADRQANAAARSRTRLEAVRAVAMDRGRSGESATTRAAGMAAGERAPRGFRGWADRRCGCGRTGCARAGGRGTDGRARSRGGGPCFCGLRGTGGARGRRSLSRPTAPSSSRRGDRAVSSRASPPSRSRASARRRSRRPRLGLRPWPRPPKHPRRRCHRPRPTTRTPPTVAKIGNPADAASARVARVTGHDRQPLAVGLASRASSRKLMRDVATREPCGRTTATRVALGTPRMRAAAEVISSSTSR